MAGPVQILHGHDGFDYLITFIEPSQHLSDWMGHDPWRRIETLNELGVVVDIFR